MPRPYPLTIRFCPHPLLIEYNNGQLFGYMKEDDDNIKCQEYAYCHLQKRKMDILTESDEKFIIYNEIFLPVEMKRICLNKLNASINSVTVKNKSGQLKRIVPFLKDAKCALLLRLLRRIGVKFKFPNAK